MKKINFNPMFYSLFVYGVSFGGEKSAPSVTFGTTEQKEQTPGTTDTGKEKIDSASLASAKKDCMTTRQSLLNKLNEALGDKDKVVMTQMRAEISSFYSTATIRMSGQTTREQFARHLAQIAEKTNEFNMRIEKLAELLRHKELCKKELKSVSDEMLLNYQKLLLDKRYSKKCEPKHILYLSSAYLLKWEAENSKAIDRIFDVTTVTRVYSDLRRREGGAFNDLKLIQEDIMRAIDQWADSQGDEDDRKVYSDRKWDNKYEAKMPSYTRLAAIGNAYVAGVSTLVPGVAPLVAGYKWSTGKKEVFDSKYVYLKGYLKWAREQAKKGEFAPLPDLERTDGGRHKVVITAGINPEKVKRNVEFGNRVVEFKDRLAEAGKNDKISFGNPKLSDEKDEGEFNIQHNNKNIGNIEIAPGGKYFLVIKDKKVDITTMAANDVIKQIQELALNPKVEKIKVSKSGGRAQVKLEGTNLPAQSASINLELGAMNLSKVGSGATDIRLAPSFKNLDDNMKAVLNGALTEYADAQRDLGPQIKSKITDQVLEDLKTKVFPKSKKPRITVVGKASLEGTWNKNKEIARKRAEAALKRLQEKNPNLTPANFEINVVSLVAGPDGKSVTTEADGWNKMKEEWNRNKDKLGEVSTIDEVKQKIRRPAAGAQAEFVKKHFTDQRGADLLILPPASDSTQFDIVMGNPSTPNTAPGPVS